MARRTWTLPKDMPSIPKQIKEIKYFIMSVNASRGILGFGTAKQGKWLEVPFRIYCDIKNSIEKSSEQDCGWKVKTETKILEVVK